MFENIMKFFKKFNKKDGSTVANSKEAAKERLHLVLMQDRANVSADFLELMKQEIIEVIKKYIDVDENAIDVRLTNKENVDGTNGAPALYANIPILNIKNEARKVEVKEEQQKEENKNEKSENKEVKKVTKKEVSKNNVKNEQEEIKEEIKQETKKPEKENKANTEQKEKAPKQEDNKEETKEELKSEN